MTVSSTPSPSPAIECSAQLQLTREVKCAKYKCPVAYTELTTSATNSGRPILENDSLHTSFYLRVTSDDTHTLWNNLRFYNSFGQTRIVGYKNLSCEHMGIVISKFAVLAPSLPVCLAADLLKPPLLTTRLESYRTRLHIEAVLRKKCTTEGLLTLTLIPKVTEAFTKYFESMLAKGQRY
ncbi:hypothetical protein DL89DRAFT_264157 [Linderina pennispora]|uniref:Uncharacterized protein n=1 Tax=Linderina pennispora TaxID=61395 RepID=A0A1Y1WKW4_9FUNG|nr:uncharacterized protein DL89DRAFT_264157 [Linderina pennispora]ORX74220.1 hypothetical protein DL89DRAFT_264157 [Linderina pennispora]